MYNLYNITADEWAALETLKRKAFEEGRASGFRAGFAAAQQQPAAKIEAAYEQGVSDAARLVPVTRKNGVGY